MIIDKLDNLRLYTSLHQRFEDVAEYLKTHDMAAMEEGRYEIDGNDLFVNIQVVKGKTPEEAILETHNKMIDIQVPISGMETYGYTPRHLLPEAEYVEANDMTLIPELMADNYVTCLPGMFVIFFPQDGHAPCISADKELKKAIFKIKAEE